MTYRGEFTWNFSGDQTVGFQAIYGMGGAANADNYLDNITLVLKPFVQFTGATLTYTEGGTQPTVGIQIVGVVPAGFSVPLTVSGTATGSGSDYSLPSAAINIPASDYGEG